MQLKHLSENEYCLGIPDNTILTEPICIIHSGKSGHISLNVICGKNSDVTVIEKIISKNDISLNHELSINIGQNSHLRSITIQDLSKGSYYEEVKKIYTSKNAKADIFNFQIGAAEAKSTIDQIMQEKKGELNIDVVSLARGCQSHDLRLRNNFLSGNGKGRITAKCIALDNSRITINGAIRIDKNGSGTDAYLKQDCLFLSRNAKIISVPALHIDTDNVKANHGASISNINDKDMFYLASRGISPDISHKMLIRGFMREVTDKTKSVPEINELIFRTFTNIQDDTQ